MYLLGRRDNCDTCYNIWMCL